MKTTLLISLTLFIGLWGCTTGKAEPDVQYLSYKLTFGSAKQASEAKAATMGPAIKKLVSEDVELSSDPYQENKKSKFALIQIIAPKDADNEEIKTKLKSLDGVVEVDIY